MVRAQRPFTLAIGLVAGLIAIPAGIAVHNYVLPIMGHAAQTDAPYRAAQRTQVRAAGRAASRSSPIGCPHRSHTP